MIIKVTIDKPVYKLSLKKDFQHFRRCKVRSFRYSQATAGQREITLVVDSMSDKCDLSYNYNYFFSNILSGYANVVATYSNQDQDIWDFVSEYPNSISQMTITTLIDNQPTTDVSPSNPILLEIELI